jgi:hypothetical protein
LHLSVLAHNPTDSLTEGFLPAAARLGLDVTVLTDQVAGHLQAPGPGRPVRVLACDVGDHRAVIDVLAGLGPVDAVFSNSDHLQTQTALAAEYFGLPGKPWTTTWTCKNKALMRRRLADQDAVRWLELRPGQDAAAGLADFPLPAVVKPREGVASELVGLARDRAELVARCADVRRRRPQAAVLVEEYLPGGLRTLETVGDGRRTHVLGGFRTTTSPPPHFVETRLDYERRPADDQVRQVVRRLTALGVGLGACHTEYVVQDDGAVRLIEVNYRAIGDQCDLLLADLLRIPYFELVLGTHLGRPLPADLATGPAGQARVEYVCATGPGVLRAAPPASRTGQDGVDLVYRPLREVGVGAPLTMTNRDYLGVVRAHGADRAAVHRAVDRFVDQHVWQISQ